MKNISESVSISDTVSRLAKHFRYLSELTIIMDLINPYRQKLRSILENLVITDTLARSMSTPDYLTPLGNVYEEYQEYCRQRKERSPDANILGIKLKEAGIDKDRLRNVRTR